MPRKNRSAFGRVFRRKGRDRKYLPGWYARFRLHGKEVTRWAGTDKKTANQFLSEMHRRSAREDLLGERTIPAVTFAEAEPAILAHFKARFSASGLKTETGRLAIMRDYFGSRALRSISAGDVQDLITHLSVERAVSNGTVNRYASTLSTAMNFAVAKGWAASNPTAGVRRSKEAIRAVGFVSVADVERLCAHARCPRYAAFVRILADTGCRSGEARRLEWRDVSLSRGSITVRESKNGRPREVPLTETAAATFADLDAERAAHPLRGPDFVWPEFATEAKSTVSGRFRRLAAKAGVSLRAHDLRHSFCSRLAQVGVPLPTVAILAGHRSVMTTQRYASHVPDGATAQAIRQLQQVEKGRFGGRKGDAAGDARHGARITSRAAGA